MLNILKQIGIAIYKSSSALLLLVVVMPISWNPILRLSLGAAIFMMALFELENSSSQSTKGKKSC